MASKRKLLTAAFVKQVRYSGRSKGADRYCDLNGLMLQVSPGGSKQWVQRLTMNGKRYDYGLGGYPVVGLREAREIALRNKQEAYAYNVAIRRGDSPLLPGFERGRRARVEGKSKPASPTEKTP